MNHIEEAQSKLKPCQCGCTFVSIRPWYMDSTLKMGQMYACCDYCHKRTKIVVNPFDAMMDWNSDRVYDKDKVYKKPYMYEKYKGFVIWHNEALDRPYYIGIVHFETLEMARNYTDRLTPMDRDDDN